jgi:ABC-type branched-subunit amino acid transport system substrate-binding protein
MRWTNSMRHQGSRTSLFWRGGAAGVAVVLVAGACGGGSKAATPGSSTSVSATSLTGTGDDIGITPTTITVGQLADVSGPIPGLFSGSVNGLDAWAAYVNSTGGIDGRKIVVDHKDSALNCTTFTNEVKSMPGDLFAELGTFSVVDTCGESTLKANPTFPDIQAAISSTALAAYPNVFLPSPTPPGSYTSGYQWVKSKYGAAAVQKTAALWAEEETQDYKNQSAAAESIGYNYVYDRGVGPTDTNFTSDILRMKADGVEVVDLTDNSVTGVADFLEQAAQQGFHPDAVIAATAYDPSLFKLLGNSADASNVVIPLPEALYLGQDDASVPEIRTMTKWLNTTHPGAPMNLYVVLAWSAGLLFQEAVTEAGPNPTRATLLAALKGVTSFDADGLLASTDPGKGIPASCVVVAGIVNGKFVRLAPRNSGFECNGPGYYYDRSL